MVIIAGVMSGVVITTRFASIAQVLDRDDQDISKPAAPSASREKPQYQENISAGSERQATQPQLESTRAASAAASFSLQEAVLRPYEFPFARPTPLAQVCNHLKQTLKAPVVIDLAALDRQNVEPEDPVQLELSGVRLKTGLKLLLDQVGLTYRIEPEDNLMVITDQEGSQDPSERIWSELRALHRDLHDVQDSLDELRAIFGDEHQTGPRVRKPTIIEELPEGAIERRERTPEKPGGSGEKPSSKPGDKPRGAVAPPGSREPTPRIPLSSRRRRTAI
jgi:hypothetical protein